MTNPIDVDLLDPLGALAGDVRDIVGDAAFLAACVRMEAALAGALADAGVEHAGAGAATRILALAGTLDVAAIARAGASGGNPVIPMLAALRERLHEADAALLHRGATSQDVLDTAFMLVAADARARITDDLAVLERMLARLADRERHTVVAARTLGQQAAPTTFGLRVAVLLDGVTAARLALADVALPAQLGGSVGTLAVLADRDGVDAASRIRTAFAARLGLADSPLPWHVQRAAVGRLAAALGLVVAAVGRLGAEIVHLAATEVGEVRLSGTAGAGASSAMPQKRNPTPAVLLVAAARRAPGLVGTVLAASLGLDERAAGDWHAEWQPLRELLRLALEAAAVAGPLAEAIVVDRDRVRANLALTGGTIRAERAGAALGQIVGASRAAALVRDGLTSGDLVAALRSASPDAARAIDAVTGDAGPVGLSDRFIDAAIAASSSSVAGAGQ